MMCENNSDQLINETFDKSCFSKQFRCGEGEKTDDDDSKQMR